MKKILLAALMGALLLAMTGCASVQQALGRIGDDIEASQLDTPKAVDNTVDWGFVITVREMATKTFTEGVPDAVITNTRVAAKDNAGKRAIVVIEYERGGRSGSYGFDYQKNDAGKYELKRYGEGVRTDDLM